eukprot:750889-Hanusia_phi.AAC.1
MGWNSLHQLGMEVNRVDDINEAIYKLGVIVAEKTDLTGMSPLHKACQYGRVQNVEKLINEGADVLATNDVLLSEFVEHYTTHRLSSAVGFLSTALGGQRLCRDHQSTVLVFKEAPGNERRCMDRSM